VRNILLPIIILLNTFSHEIHADTPMSFSYQTYLRDGDNNPISDPSAIVKIRILQGSSSGDVVFEELHSGINIQVGVISIMIGSGVSDSSMASINWLDGPFFIESSVDLEETNNFEVVSTSVVSSVPMVYVAGQALDDQVTDADANPTNELNISLSLNGTSLEIEDDGGTVSADLAFLSDGTEDDDSDANNEIQTISRSGRTISINNGGGSVRDSVIEYSAGQGIVIENNIISTEPCDYAIGDTFGGGIIFYMDPSGCHGLIHAMTIFENVKWDSRSSPVVTGVGLEAIYAGEQNTEVMRRMIPGPNDAANVCTNYAAGGFDDWYLPTSVEIYHLFRYNRTTQIFDDSYYWLSLELSRTKAYTQRLNAYVFTNFDKDVGRVVIPIRSF